MMQYIYAAMWFIIGILLTTKLRKENKIFTFVGGIFFFMGVWWLLDAILPELKMFEGTYGWIFRGVMAVTLIITAYVYYKQKQKDKESDQEPK